MIVPNIIYDVFNRETESSIESPEKDSLINRYNERFSIPFFLSRKIHFFVKIEIKMTNIPINSKSMKIFQRFIKMICSSSLFLLNDKI